MKKLLCLILAAAMIFCLPACGKTPESSGENPPEPTSETPVGVIEIEIPTVTVDLSAPENKVGVSAAEKSEVFDSSGRKLTAEEWLLNSKFSKAYIKRLGAGEYTFSYKSETKKGTIKLIVTDDGKPNYVFASEVPDTLNYLEKARLPRLVREQDSYQDDYSPAYSLKKGDEEIEVAETDDGEGFVSSKLEAGDYVWKAVIEKDGKTFEYARTFSVTTFEQWLTSIQDEIILDKQTGEYIKAENGKYPIDTTNNGDMFSYTIDNSVLRIAMTAGKTMVKAEVLSDRLIDGGETVNNGTLWLSNGWKGYQWAFSGANEYTEDKSKDKPPRISGMKKDGDKFNYYTTGYLNNSYFSAESKNPLQLDFANGAKAKTLVTITFM